MTAAQMVVRMVELSVCLRAARSAAETVGQRVASWACCLVVSWAGLLADSMVEK